MHTHHKHTDRNPPTSYKTDIWPQPSKIKKIDVLISYVIHGTSPFHFWLCTRSKSWNVSMQQLKFAHIEPRQSASTKVAKMQFRP